MNKFPLLCLSTFLLGTTFFFSCKKDQKSTEEVFSAASLPTEPIAIGYYITDGRNSSFKLRDIPSNVDMVVLFGIKYFHYLDTLKYPAGGAFDMMKSYKTYGEYFSDIKSLQKRGIKVIQNVDDDVSWQKGALQWKDGGPTLKPAAWADSLKKLLVDQYHLDGISLDIEHSGEVPNPIPPFPKYEDIGYKGWYSTSMAATPTFLQCIRELTRYFGLKAGLGLELQTASGPDTYSWDPIAANFRDAFTYFQIQSYSVGTTRASYIMKHLTNVNKIPSNKIIFGAEAEADHTDGRSNALALSSWTPTQGPKGGMMIYTYNSDPEFGKQIVNNTKAVK